MDHMRALGLLDSNGKPLGDRIERVLAGLLPKLRRRFPNLQDDVAITEVMEEAGHRIASREARGGPIERIHGYAWVTVRSVATSHIRRPATRLIQQTLAQEASHEHIAVAQAQFGSPEQVERDILLREVLARLSPEERMVCLWKMAGFSAQEIASALGRSVVSVDTLFSRAKQKIRSDVSISQLPRTTRQLVPPKRQRSRSQATGTIDGRRTTEVKTG